MSKTTDFDKKKTQEILGVNATYKLGFNGPTKI
jgi:hypothetical protein